MSSAEVSSIDSRSDRVLYSSMRNRFLAVALQSDNNALRRNLVQSPIAGLRAWARPDSEPGASAVCSQGLCLGQSQGYFRPFGIGEAVLGHSERLAGDP